MKANDYQEMAMRTSGHLDGDEQLVNAALALTGEAGEVADLIKKYKYHGHPLDPGRVAEELGDVLWGVAYMCDALGIKMGDVMGDNLEKLQQRYPEGFNSQDSIHRERYLANAYEQTYERMSRASRMAKAASVDNATSGTYHDPQRYTISYEKNEEMDTLDQRQIGLEDQMKEYGSRGKGGKPAPTREWTGPAGKLEIVGDGKE